MVRICPKPSTWNDAYQRLVEFSQAHPCNPASPPKPLILGGWTYSTDLAKMKRWHAIIEWATLNGCYYIVELTDEEFYYTTNPTTYDSSYRKTDDTPKTRPMIEETKKYLELLASNWSQIVGPELSKATQPLVFTGAKLRRLVVAADEKVSPPWGSWSILSSNESSRRTFTRFRSAINDKISPHHVDHIDFKTVFPLQEDKHTDNLSKPDIDCIDAEPTTT